MNSPADPGKRPAEKPPAKRRYNSPLRQQQSAETRERIVLAGVDLVHGFTTWDWTNLTARAVSERAGVSERTVYRHFTSEKNLRDAVMQRLVSDSGIELGEMRIEDFPGITARMYQFLSAFATVTQQPPQDPTFASMDEVRREALLDAVRHSLADWEPAEQRVVAAMLDLFWHPPAYERMLNDWGLSPERASGLFSWMIETLLQAIREGRHP